MGSTAEKLKYLLDQYQKGTLTEEQYKIERKLVLRSIKLAKVSK